MPKLGSRAATRLDQLSKQPNLSQSCRDSIVLDTYTNSVGFALPQFQEMVYSSITESDLQHLQLFTEYGRLAIESKCNSYRSGEKPFPVLQFLVKDWSYPYAYAYGGEGGKKLLEKILQVSDNPPELQQIRNHVRSCFQRIDCYLMPHPGDKVATNHDFDGRLKDMRPDFQKSLKSYIEYLLDPNNLVEKKINDSIVTGKDLLIYFKAYINIFHGNKLTEPKSMYIATAEANNLTTVAMTRDLYYREMELICGPDKPYLIPEHLKTHHNGYAEMALDTFTQARKMGDAKFTQQYAENLEEELKQLYQYYIKLNDRKKTVENVWSNGRGHSRYCKCCHPSYSCNCGVDSEALNLLCQSSSRPSRLYHRISYVFLVILVIMFLTSHYSYLRLLLIL